jgi:hypothetical protein
MARPEKREIVWTKLAELERQGLGRREIVSDKRDKFMVNTMHPRVTRLTTQPDAEGFIRSDTGSLLFRNASASIRMGLPPALKAKAMKSNKGLEFRWSDLEESDIRSLFTIIKDLAGATNT